eukprot:jgi/Tetstr1/437440/TSEL_026121.t1
MAWQGLRRRASPELLAGLAPGGSASRAFLWGSHLHADVSPKELPHASLRKGDPNRKQRVIVLGTGWGAVSALRSLDTDKHDVWCVSPRNYFLFTPLLPSAAVGDARKGGRWWTPCAVLFETESRLSSPPCNAIDPLAKTITCQPEAACELLWAPRLLGSAKLEAIASSSSRVVVDSTRARPRLDIQYDKLVIAVGAQVNTFDTPGVSKHAHFLKELPDARRIRSAVSDAFESAAMPDLPKEERRRLLHFIVVGGGPTGVEFAAEMADLVKEDARKAFPRQCEEDVKISLIEVQDHVLKHISAVNSDSVELQDRDSKKVWDEPCSMVVWATGIGCAACGGETHGDVGAKEYHRGKRWRTTLTLEVLGDKLEEYFPQCDKKEKGYLAKEDSRSCCKRQMPVYGCCLLQRRVATQQGEFLGKHLNALTAGNQETAKQRFRYTHLGSMVYIGDDTAGVDFTGAQGSIPQWLR